MPLAKHNDTLQANPMANTVITNNHIASRGSDWYFAMTAVMMVSTIAFMGMPFMKPNSQRLFHYITAVITLVVAIAYFSMGSNLGLDRGPGGV